MSKPKKLFVGTVLMDVLTQGKLEIVNISIENIDGWSTYMELKREDGTLAWYEIKTIVALINSNLIMVDD